EQLMRRGSIWLKNQEDSSSVKEVRDEPRVKAMIDDVRKQRDEAAEKVLAYCEDAVAEAEKLTLPPDQSYLLGNIKAHAGTALKDHPRLAEFQSRLDK